MDSRTSVWLSTIALALACAGCITDNSFKHQSTTQNQTGPSLASLPSNAAREEFTGKPKKDTGPKRNPMPRTEVSIGALKEADADSEAGKKNPELQSRLRDQARQAYQHALKLDPSYIDAYRHLGRLYTKIGDYDRAFDTYKKAMALQPKDAALWYDLGLCHNRRKDFDESVRCFQRALELDPENREFLKTLGFTLAWMGQTPQGLNYLTRALGSAMANYNLGRVLLERGQRDQAQHHLRIALRENPQLEPYTREMLASLETSDAATSQRGAVEAP